MPFFPKPAAGSWTENWPELGTTPVNYTDSIDPEHWLLEQQAIFKKTWLKVGRVEQLPKKGSYFTREIPSVGPGTSLIIVKEKEEVVRAFHNLCRHRGNKLAWSDCKAAEMFPKAKTSIKAAYEAGVKIAVGSDAPAIPHGKNADELVTLVDWGMPPAAVLRAATVVAADLINRTDLGRLAEDYLGNVIAVPGDPLLDITVTQNVSFVMKAGQGICQQELMTSSRSSSSSRSTR